MRAMGEPVPPPASSDTSSSEAPTDESIGTEIRRRLNADPTTAVGIVAEVEDGKVTLRGAAPNLAVSWRAEGATRGVKGVKSVVNQIIVNTPAIGQ
jgi:osmotically-inducible protein OsmY